MKYYIKVLRVPNKQYRKRYTFEYIFSKVGLAKRRRSLKKYGIRVKVLSVRQKNRVKR